MKKLLPLLALSLALSFSACTKKEAAPEGAADQQQVEGTTSAPSDQAAPSEEMQEKKDEAAPAAQ